MLLLFFLGFLLMRPASRSAGNPAGILTPETGSTVWEVVVDAELGEEEEEALDLAVERTLKAAGALAGAPRSAGLFSLLESVDGSRVFSRRPGSSPSMERENAANSLLIPLIFSCVSGDVGLLDSSSTSLIS